jgi:short-subunit dehydrogenase
MMQTTFGPWAVVTGASSGIGEAFARALAADGLHLVLVARRAERLAALGAELGAAHGVEHRVLAVDLSVPDGPERVVDATADLDVGLLVSNAGAGHPGRFVDQELEDLHRRLRLNAVAHLELAHAFSRRLVARGRGGVVLVSALGASAGIPNMGHESGAKAYVDALGTALHHELAGSGVSVLVMRPGNVDTAIIDSFGLDRADLPLRPISAANAVAETLAALRKGRAAHLPDRRMRLLNRLTPTPLAIRMNGRMLGQAAARLTASPPAAPRAVGPRPPAAG